VVKAEARPVDRPNIVTNKFRWPVVVLFWTAMALSFATNLHLSQKVPWREAILSSLADWYSFALLSIPMLRLARRFQFHSDNWRTTALLHLFASVFFSGFWIMLRVGLAQLQRAVDHQPTDFSTDFVNLFIKSFHLNLWIYWVILAVSHAVEYYRKLSDRELKTAELERSLTQAKLRALQSQLNPHFLFNTLHTISALMHIDVEKADRMVAKLSDLLRYALDNTDEHVIPLRDEIAFLKRYLEIEQTRFGDRLTVTMDFPEDTLNVEVPNLILQPIVENAIRHGIEPHAKPGKIHLSGRRENGQLILQVRDNGAGLRPDNTRQGIGTSNTRQRLHQLYADRQTFTLENARDGGLLATIKLPVREE
jgi:two-component system, LytTR family, sensor kinase